MIWVMAADILRDYKAFSTLQATSGGVYIIKRANQTKAKRQAKSEHGRKRARKIV